MPSECRSQYATFCCLCCCGGLPIIAVVKAALTIPFALVVFVGGNTFLSLILIPHDFVYTYRAVVATSAIGTNLKIAAMLLTPFAILTWPIFVCFVSIVTAVFYPIGIALGATFSDSGNLIWGGTCIDCTCTDDEEAGNPIFDLVKWVGDFWDFNYYSYYSVTEELRNHVLQPGEQPFDVPVHKVFFGLIQACLCIVISLCINSITFVFTFPLFMISSLYMIIKILIETAGEGGLCCLMLPLNLGIGIGIVWPLSLVAYILMQLVFYPIYIGPQSAMVSYTQNNFCDGFKNTFWEVSLCNSMFLRVATMCCDVEMSRTNEDMMYLPHCGNPKVKLSLLNQQQRTTYRTTSQSDFRTRPNQGPRQVSFNSNISGSTPTDTDAILLRKHNLKVPSKTDTLINLLKIYDLLYEQIELLILESLRKKFINIELVFDATNSAPQNPLCLRVLEAASIQLAIRSLNKDLGWDDLLMSDGSIVTTLNRPKNWIANTIYPHLLDIKHKLYVAIIQDNTHNTTLQCSGGTAPVMLNAVEEVSSNIDTATSKTGAAKDIEEAKVVVKVIGEETEIKTSDNNCWSAYLKFIMSLQEPRSYGTTFNEAFVNHQTNKEMKYQMLEAYKASRKISKNIKFLIGFKRRFTESANKAVNTFLNENK